MSRSYRFRKRVSDRSGFDYLYNEIVNDEGSNVGPDEYDTPPPSDIPLGGEGDRSPGDIRSDYAVYSVATSDETKVQYLTTASTISWTAYYDASGQRNYNKAIVYISGSNSDVVLASNPQVSSGKQGDILTIQGVGSAVTLVDGNGLSLRKTFMLNSGAIINLFYTTGGNVWNETSRNHITENLGEF